ARRTGEPVRGVTAKGDEIRNLLRLDPVALPYLGGADPRKLGDASHGLEDRRPLARELEGVAVGSGHKRQPAPLLLGSDRRREEVVGLVPRPLRAGEPHRLDELWEQGELLDELGVEHAPALVRVEGLVTVRRDLQRVPGDEYR